MREYMPANRYFSPQEYQEGNSIFLEDQEFHHLIHVMRQQTGEEVELVNGKGQLAQARIAKIEKKRAELKPFAIIEASHLEQPLILAQAIPRLNKLEFILEKGTELGMTQLWLFPSKQSEKGRFSDHQLQRLNTILIAAMKQCGRLFLPEIISMPPLEQWQKFCFPAFFGDTRTTAPSFETIWNGSSAQSGSIFCVGPESGFTVDEVALMQQLGALGVKLNPHILRTETAAIAALSLIGQWQLDSIKGK
ncbi:MAG: RsmE family RNA methyltransferase [Micropruina sp.]|uniref:RsmE family RNA methyltransferase n=1 Tax=Micropruina sp. TaxID=2737536 RepID=UPI0039E701FC